MRSLSVCAQGAIWRYEREKGGGNMNACGAKSLVCFSQNDF